MAFQASISESVMESQDEVIRYTTGKPEQGEETETGMRDG